jgi:hypothetical protein
MAGEIISSAPPAARENSLGGRFKRREKNGEDETRLELFLAGVAENAEMLVLLTGYNPRR